MPEFPLGLVYAVAGAVLASVLLPGFLLLMAFVRPVRRSRGVRDLVFLLLGMEIGFVPLVVGFVGQVQEQEEERSRAVADGTLHLDAPRTIDGIEFPAGSSVYADPEGRVRWGNVPRATMIKGVPLVGAFRVGSFSALDPPGGLSQATLAAETEVRGVACAPGPFELQQDGIRCTLARDHDYLGLMLMGGRTFGVGREFQDRRMRLNQGTLAHSERLDGADWPAGTIIAGVSDPVDQLRQGSELAYYPIQLCLEPGAVVMVKGATLHGPIAYTFSGVQRWFDSTCRPLTTFSTAAPRYTDGYAEVGNQRFQEGTWSAENGWYKTR